jgi:uncharacterized integral membrane protein
MNNLSETHVPGPSTGKVEVNNSKSQVLLLVLLGLVFVPLGVLSVLNGLLSGLEVVPLGIGMMCLLIFGFVLWIVLRAYRRSIKYLTQESLTRNDGRTFSWSELSKVVNKVRLRPSGKKFIWRTEIQFQDGGSAWIIPSKVSNYAEIDNLVRSLPCEHTEERA